MTKEKYNAFPMNAQVNQSLRYSYYNGIFASCMTGLTQEYLTPFLLLLNAAPKHVGFLNAFPNLFASLVQLKSAEVTEKLQSRRKMVCFFVLLQALTLLLMSFMAFTGLKSPAIFITVVILFSLFAAIHTPAWSSLMVDLVPEDKRGEYFGWRNRNLGFVVVGATLATGFILQKMQMINVFYGFVIVFGLAFLCRITSWYFITKMYEPPLTFAKEHYFSFFQFLARSKKSNFAKFVLFISMMSFSVNLAAPFFPVLMLQDLHFSYILYTVTNIFTTLALHLTMNRWGRHADRMGNLKIIRLTAPLIGIIPLFWIINRQPIYLFFVQVFSGFLWSGFNLCSSNYIYDAVTAGKRTRCVAYFNVLNGMALSAGAVLGGYLVTKLPALFGYKILTLFLISAILRIVVALIMPRKLKEVRAAVEKVSSNQLFFSMIGIKPVLGIERKTIRF